MTNALAVSYTTDNGQEISITAQDVRDVCAIGNQVTDKEVRQFLELCAAQRLNPFIKEAYLIKYGQQATIITGKDVFTKRAYRNPKFQGFKAGVYVQTTNGAYKEREGSMVLPGETVLGGWAEVYMQGYQVPVKDTVAFAEYSTGKSNWTKMPGTMIRKVALVHALREAMPEEYQGLYDASEMGQAIEEQSFEPVKPKSEPKPTEKPSKPSIQEDMALVEVQSNVGALMRLLKAEGKDIAQIKADAYLAYGTEVADMSVDQLHEFQKDLEAMVEAPELEVVEEF